MLARKTGLSVSGDAKKRIAELRHYPTIDTWRNPLTRSIARRLVDDAWSKSLEELDFEYRLSDTMIDGVPCVEYETAGTKPDAPIILYVHGGGFVAGSPKVCAGNVLPVCHLSGCSGLGVDYSLLPQHAYPTQIDEVDRVYAALLERDPSRKIFLLSDSTGAAIALSAMMRWRTKGLPSPSGAIFLSPCVDGAAASDTQITNNHHDPLIPASGGKFIRRLFRFYAPENELKDPGVSPLYGEFDYLPPFMIHVGSREVLLGDAARLSEAARKAGVETHLRVFDGMYHRFHMNWGLEETKSAHADLADFILSL